MSEKIQITKARDKHIPEIVELWKEFMDYHKEFDSRFPMRENAYLSFQNHLKELMTSENKIVYIALDNDHVVGFATCSINTQAPIWEIEKYGTIDTLVVESQYRRKGIGAKMLSTINEWFGVQSIVRIEVSLAIKNQVAQSFWRKHGYQDHTLRLYLDTHDISTTIWETK